jgi:membrane-associated phospholipid phosphatase
MLQEDWNKEKNLSYRLAYIMSRLFDTTTTLFATSMTFVLKAEAQVAWILTMGLGDILPILFLLYSFRTNRIADLDLTSRQERTIWFSVAAAFWTLTLFVVLLVDAIHVPDIMKTFQIWLAIFGILNAGITYFWKISGHIMVATALSLWLSFLWDLRFLVLLVTFVPLLAWARLRLQKHTLSEITAAFFVMLIVTPLVWFVFGM